MQRDVTRFARDGGHLPLFLDLGQTAAVLSALLALPLLPLLPLPWARAASRMRASSRAGSGMSQIGRDTSELQSPDHLVCRLLLEKKKTTTKHQENERSLKQPRPSHSREHQPHARPAS